MFQGEPFCSTTAGDRRHGLLVQDGADYTTTWLKIAITSSEVRSSAGSSVVSFSVTGTVIVGHDLRLPNKRHRKIMEVR